MIEVRQHRVRLSLSKPTDSHAGSQTVIWAGSDRQSQSDATEAKDSWAKMDFAATATDG